MKVGNLTSINFNSSILANKPTKTAITKATEEDEAKVILALVGLASLGATTALYLKSGKKSLQPSTTSINKTQNVINEITEGSKQADINNDFIKNFKFLDDSTELQEAYELTDFLFDDIPEDIFNISSEEIEFSNLF